MILFDSESALRFTIEGTYKAGNEVVPIGTRVSIDLFNMWDGWVKWRDNKPIEVRMGRVVYGYEPKSRKRLNSKNAKKWPDKRDPWVHINQIDMVNIETGKKYAFITSTLGGISEIRKLCLRYTNTTNPRPLTVELNVNVYQHKTYGKILLPRFDVVSQKKVRSLAAERGAVTSRE